MIEPLYTQVVDEQGRQFAIALREAINKAQANGVDAQTVLGVVAHTLGQMTANAKLKGADPVIVAQLVGENMYLGQQQAMDTFFGVKGDEN